MYAIYNGSGSFECVIEDLNNGTSNRLIRFDTLYSVFSYLADRYQSFSIDDLSLVHYGVDTRIKKDIFLVVTKRRYQDDYITMYGSSMFVCYLIEVPPNHEA